MGAKKMAGTPRDYRVQPTSSRRTHSEALVSRTTGKLKAAGEAEERLRHSMQTFGGSNKGGMVRWSSTVKARTEGSEGNQSRAISAQRNKGDMQVLTQSTPFKEVSRGEPNRLMSSDRKPHVQTDRQLSQSMNIPATTARLRPHPIHSRPPKTATTGPNKHSQGEEASFRQPPVRLTAAAVSQNSPALDSRPAHDAVSEAGTHADWWRPDSTSASVVSYPMTAVTDRGGSVAGTELRLWMERLSQLENAVSDERSKRKQFEEELKKLQSDSMFQVSRGYLTTGKPGINIATIATKKAIEAGRGT
ncbi:hypothetical protein CEUSTIGMA_g9444.t1 [Chlamydomonas eustigma]|uniref:Uncharacterized protein n=1 Tax=Chlamydomonas eustigma TaxID=1157962 RepID=A0A250XG57_9CHLO|nr:hypothetical protein CEUSTIGMA_g9444.t1 [Chlamydomonas eustigma]|eukprot:GAX82016.1 hypothetical protein CEUSTIGMA_g9444.t1 [Chlamydomonas eustigma]